VLANGKTLLHKHRLTEEIYHITDGSGIMTLGSEEFEVKKGDTVCISPDTPHSEGSGIMTLGPEKFEVKKGDTVCISPCTLHRIQNTGNMPLIILCCCAPAYSHEDTELME